MVLTWDATCVRLDWIPPTVVDTPLMAEFTPAKPDVTEFDSEVRAAAVELAVVPTELTICERVVSWFASAATELLEAKLESTVKLV